METLSLIKLSEIVKSKRNDLGYSQEIVGNLTGINRLLIGRLEKGNFIPSIEQFEKLSKVLQFDANDVFESNNPKDSFLALRSGNLNDDEKKGVEVLISMILTLRQQIVLRDSYNHETNY